MAALRSHNCFFRGLRAVAQDRGCHDINLLVRFILKCAVTQFLLTIGKIHFAWTVKIPACLLEHFFLLPQRLAYPPCLVLKQHKSITLLRSCDDPRKVWPYVGLGFIHAFPDIFSSGR
jgi:hypothetical protein